jgi:hypothetical protein
VVAVVHVSDQINDAAASQREDVYFVKVRPQASHRTLLQIFNKLLISEYIKACVCQEYPSYVLSPVFVSMFEHVAFLTEQARPLVI